MAVAHTTHQRLERITRLTAISIALLIALAVPTGFFVTGYIYERQILRGQAAVAAAALSQHIYVTPKHWDLQHHRLVDLLNTKRTLELPVFSQVVSLQGEEIVATGEPQAWPSHWMHDALSNGVRDVAWLRMQASLRPLLENTLIALVIAIGLAAATYYVLRVLPFAALGRVLRALEVSQERLKRAIQVRQQLLDKHRQVSEALRYQASHDALTDLPNRASFSDRLNDILSEAGESQCGFTVMLIDLNRFKEINDALGHRMGDRLLVEVSRRIRAALPATSMLARLGGDEYAVLVPGNTRAEAQRQAEAIQSALGAHILLDEYHLAVQASIGLARYPEDGRSNEQLLGHADVAMYHAKKSAKPYTWYDHSYDDSSPGRLGLTADLRYALDKGGLSLHYQPKLDLRTGEVWGVEALARWQHPKHGWVSPEVFIAIAEQAGMIGPLTAWVLDRALEQLAHWRDQGIELHMAVNISAYNLQDESLLTKVRDSLVQHDLPATRLTLEITESSMMLDPQKSRQVIRTFAQRGVRIAVDDFGTGYSSLGYLKRLTLHELKIDRSFIKNMLQDHDDRVIVRSTIELAHNLHLQVVAEGVEDEETLQVLKEYACDLVQGYHICRPQDADTLNQWLSTRGQECLARIDA